jgi:predicted GNAT superfamily acetyltransferase
MSAWLSNTPASVAGITLRKLGEPEEMRACVDLQKTVWGFSDLELVPHPLFVVAYRTGGQVIGAFDRERAVGFVLAFPAYRSGELYLHSHMTAVLPQYQNRGIGRELKLAQREDALSRDIHLVEWTFDPLELRNAHFNIARLGAVVRQYLPNLYGRTTSPLHHGLPTDRLVAQWWIREARVQQILSQQVSLPTAARERVSVPGNVQDILEHDPERAKQLQSQVREQFQGFFAQGLAVTGFDLDGQSAHYLLEPL